MIGHYVLVGPSNAMENISNYVKDIKITQTMSTDSDPAKATITCANPRQYFFARYPPQYTEFYITLFNHVGTPYQQEWPGLTGHITDLEVKGDEAVIQCECDMGHLADSITNQKQFDPDHLPPGSNSSVVMSEPVLKYMMSLHVPPITVNYTARNVEMKSVTYEADTTYQDVVNDIQKLTGAVYYFKTPLKLEFRDPTHYKGVYNLDPFVLNPEKTESMMGYCNVVKVTGDNSIVNNHEQGSETASAEPISVTYMDLDSVQSYGWLEAPEFKSYEIATTQAAVLKAKQLLFFFRMHKHALTKPIVAGMAPPIQSLVAYTPFTPINVTGGTFGQVKGVVVEREIEYNASDGFTCTLTVSPDIQNRDDVTNSDPIESMDENMFPEESGDLVANFVEVTSREAAMALVNG